MSHSVGRCSQWVWMSMFTMWVDVHNVDRCSHRLSIRNIPPVHPHPSLSPLSPSPLRSPHPCVWLQSHPSTPSRSLLGRTTVPGLPQHTLPAEPAISPTLFSFFPLFTTMPDLGMTRVGEFEGGERGRRAVGVAVCLMALWPDDR